MATRSYIAIQVDGPKCDYIYCHWDGYLSHNGAILLERYNERKKVQLLIEAGDRSSLDEDKVYGEPCNTCDIEELNEAYNYVYTLDDVWIYRRGNGNWHPLTTEETG